uniref:Ig-like domain-containing protein n=1 Tax=Terrapene triunguis TaxID=2587831 RepID=A0A674IW69_9SAUR
MGTQWRSPGTTRYQQLIINPPSLLPGSGGSPLLAVQDPRYQINQTESLSAPAGGSVTLPCAFTYPREIEPLGDVRIYWRLGFHGKFIYNHTEGFTHPDYGGRIVLVGDPRGSRTASIRIDQLRESDASEYVCHVMVQKNDGTWEQWRRHPGTNLTVTGAPIPCQSVCMSVSPWLCTHVGEGPRLDLTAPLISLSQPKPCRRTPPARRRRRSQPQPRRSGQPGRGQPR